MTSRPGNPRKQEPLRRAASQFADRVGLRLAQRHCLSRGQDLVEYAALLGFVAILCLAALGSYSGSIQAVFQALVDRIALAFR
jgi:Flp pilus assembly pilin Flp